MNDSDVRGYKDQLNKEWSEARKDKTAKGQLREKRLGRRWSLVHKAINEGVKSVAQLQSLVENLSHNWSLDDDKVNSFKEAINVEWYDHKDNEKDSEAEEIITKRLGRRWSLVHKAINEGVESVAQLQYILLHKTCKWQLDDKQVNVFKGAKDVEWYDANDLEKYKDKAREFSNQWSSIHSEIRKGCTSVKKLQDRLNLPVDDNLQGDYDDYEMDAVSIGGMSPRKAATRPVKVAQKVVPKATKKGAPNPEVTSPPQKTTTAEPALKQSIKLQPAEWYCVLNGQSFGPVNISQFANMSRFGIVDRTTLVWRNGMAQWAVASTITQFTAIV